MSKSVTTDNAQLTTKIGNVGNNGIEICFSENVPKVSAQTNPITTSNQNSEGCPKRVINISVLNEVDLLNLIKGYVNSMTDFAKTRNVHKELEDTLTNTALV